MASQEMLDRYALAGQGVVDAMVAVGEVHLPDSASKMDRDFNIGRDLAVSVFLAAIGDEKVNRIWLIQGFAHAIGEACAQQPPEVANSIVEAMNSGFAEGARLGGVLAVAGHA